ncbi:hypothetical protein S40288_10331 [Stachybotrys chartarum IBT 40288]|nr:hypothetical protein S40288_10331 [Stachybotrys chartarum IBT 40288]
MSLTEQCGRLFIDVKPLLSEVLEFADFHPALTIYIGFESVDWRESMGCKQSFSNDIHLTVNSKKKMLDVYCPTYPKQLSAYDHSPGDLLEWLDGSQHSMLAAVYARLLGPFTDVVCICAQSFPSRDDLSSFLASWKADSSSYSTAVVLPRFIVITEGVQSTAEELDRHLRQSLGCSRANSFSNLIVVSLDVSKALLRRQTAQIARLKKLILNHVDSSRREKQRAKVLYDAVNLVSLFGKAYDCLRMNNPFDPILASRVSYRLPLDMARQIQYFLSDFRDEESLRKFALPYLHSAVRMNAFPRGLHEFRFKDVFETLYKPDWRQAAHALNLSSDSLALLEDLVMDKRGLSDGQADSKELTPPTGQQNDNERTHLQNLEASRHRWQHHKSSGYCPLCVLRRPRYGLPCGHVFCGRDIRLIGHEVAPNTFSVEQCICCQTRLRNVIFRFRPRTRAVRGLSLDGGGVRGILHLKILQLLESRMKRYLPDTPIINFFDIAAGTSSGMAARKRGICVLTLAHKGTLISNAIVDFMTLSQDVFAKKPWCARLLNLAIRGSVYDRTTIDRTLQKYFGSSTLTDYTPATARDAVVLVTTKGAPTGDHAWSNLDHIDFDRCLGQKGLVRSSLYAWEA